MGGTDRLLVAPNERVDLEDFDHAVNEGLNAATQQTPGNFLTTPEGDRAWILEGFEVDNSDGFPNPPDLGGIQVRVTRGRAILSRIESGVVSYGIVSTLGDPEKIINISSFSNGTFGVYIRFQFVDGDLESRAFWDSSGATGFSQSVATRRKANWSMRIESTNPGAEWLKVADMTVAAGVVSALVDLRPFYFEGRIDKSYDSGWSTDSDPTGTDDLLPVVPIVAAGLPTWPGGTGIAAIVTITDTSEITAEDFVRLDSDGRWYKVFSVVPSTSFVVEDVHGHGGTFPSGAGQSSLQIHRGTARSEDGVPDLQTFTAAMRQCLEDLKGRGLRRWWARDIGGMNIGFDADPAEDTLQIGDDDFKISNITPSPASFPGFQFDTGGDIFFYDRAANTYRAQIAGASEWTLDAAGVTITNGLSVGHLTTPVDDVISIGDVNFSFNFDSGNDPGTIFDANDSFLYNRVGDIFNWSIASAVEMSLDADELTLATTNGAIISNGGLVVGFAGAPTADAVDIGDTEFSLDYNSGDPFVNFNTTGGGGIGRIAYTRATDLFSFTMGGSLIMTMSPGGMTMNATLATPMVRFNNLGAGPALELDGDTSSPTRGMLVITPQDAEPSGSPVAGEAFLHDANNKLSIYDGVGFNRYITQGLGSAVVSTQLVNSTTTERAFDLFRTLPANSTRSGSTFRIRAFLKIDTQGGIAIVEEVRLYLGDQADVTAVRNRFLTDLNGAGIGTTIESAAMMEFFVHVRSIGAGNWNFTGTYTLGVLSAGIRSGDAKLHDWGENAGGTLDTTQPIDICVTAKWDSTGTNAAVTLLMLVVDEV